MNLLKKGMYILLGLSITYACNNDDDDNGGGGSSTTITNVDFEISVENDNGNQVGVTPSSTGGTSYSIDFNDPSVMNDEDIIATDGPKAIYTYPEETASYDITVTASAANAENVNVTKTHTVTYEAPTVLADFENEAILNLRDDTGDGATIVVEDQMGADGMTKVGAITNTGLEWEAISINNSKHVKVSGSKSIITIDYYQSEAAARTILLKLEGAMSTAEGVMPDVEVSTTTESTTGWQTLEFDFSKDAGNSYPNHENPTVILDQYQKIVFFVDAGSAVAGTYWIDNVQGAEFGDDVPDTDGDGKIDSIDGCVDTASDEADGCPLPSTGTDPQDDFEGTGNITWVGDGGTGVDASFENPNKAGINESNTVLQYSDTGQQYANIRFDLNEEGATYDLTTKNVFTLKVYVPTPEIAHTEPMTLALKLQDGTSAAPWEGQVVVSKAYTYDSWQEISFDFSEHSAATKFNRVVIQFNGEANYEWVTAYIDDLTYGSN